jgi:hypothetical protein
MPGSIDRVRCREGVPPREFLAGLTRREGIGHRTGEDDVSAGALMGRLAGLPEEAHAHQPEGYKESSRRFRNREEKIFPTVAISVLVDHVAR